MALSVPLSRFTSRVGGGSAFYVRRLMSASTKHEWLHDMLWSWNDSESTHGKAGSRQKFQSLTLTMTHRPTNTIVSKSSAFVPNKSDELAKLRREMWSELLHELQQRRALKSSC